MTRRLEQAEVCQTWRRTNYKESIDNGVYLNITL